jgi:hypothetical protein
MAAETRTYRTAGTTPTLGMRGSGSWTEAEQPDSYRKGILLLYPNGAPLTAMTAKLKSRKETSKAFHWEVKSLPDLGAAVTGVYEDPAMSNAYDAGDDYAENSMVYLKVAEAFASRVVTGVTVIMRQAASGATPADLNNDIYGLVTDVQRAGVMSRLSVRLLEADGASHMTTDLASCNRVVVTGNAYPEGAPRPPSYSFNATDVYNYMQIFRNSLEETATQMAISGNILGDTYKELKRETLEQHALAIEQALIFGRRSWHKGVNGQEERTMMGIIPFIRTYASANLIDYARSTTYAGKTWLEGGETFLDDAIKTSFTYGTKMERTVFCGAGALAGVQKMVKNAGMYSLTPGTASYGIKVATLDSIFGTWHLIKHPLFTHESSMTNTMLVVDPSMIEFTYLRDTQFKGDTTFKQGGGDGIDGIREEFITEASLSMYYPELGMFLSNVGVDNIV